MMHTGAGLAGGSWTRSAIGLTATAVLLTLGVGTPALGAEVPEGPAPVVVGLPYLHADNRDTSDDGGILLRSTTGSVQLFTPADLGLAPFANFGTAVAVGDLDRDGRDDLVIGTPGPVGVTTASGRVDLVFGAPAGYGKGRASIALTGIGDEEFGASVALVRLKGSPSAATPITELFIGAPGAEVNGLRGAGAVHHYRIAADGKPTFMGRLTQDSTLPGGAEAGIEGVAEDNDRFGSVLAPGYGQVIVGSPTEDIGTALVAGAIHALDLAADGRVRAGRMYSQNSRGVAGHAEVLDLFGSSISFGGYVVGVPGESVGKLRNAGMVQTFRAPSAGSSGLVPVHGLTQDSPGVPGAAEEGDSFGFAVAFGRLLCDTAGAIAVAAPYEGLGRVRETGSVTVLPWNPPVSVAPACTKAEVLSQAVGGRVGAVPGVAERGDYLGQGLGVLAAAGAGPRRDTLVIGIPGEKIGRAIEETGRVAALFPGGTRSWGVPGDLPIALLLSSPGSTGPQFGG